MVSGEIKEKSSTICKYAVNVSIFTVRESIRCIACGTRKIRKPFEQIPEESTNG